MWGALQLGHMDYNGKLHSNIITFILSQILINNINPPCLLIPSVGVCSLYILCAVTAEFNADANIAISPDDTLLLLYTGVGARRSDACEWNNEYWKVEYLRHDR